MLPVVIAQNNNLHDFFTIFISGVTGIPTGLSLHKMPDMKNIPLIRIVPIVSIDSSIGQIFNSLAEIWISETGGCDHSCKKQRNGLILQAHYGYEQRKLMQLQRKMDSSTDVKVIEKYYR